MRLEQGDFDRETRYDANPIDVARSFVAAGARRLHVVDLDGARDGAPTQAALIERIVAAVAPVEVEVGGGLRDASAVERVLSTGAAFAIVGTMAAQDPGAFEALCKQFPGRIIAGIDARDRLVAVSGWKSSTELDACDLARDIGKCGAAAIIFTDIARDGTGQGPNVELTAEIGRAAEIPVIASGGVGELGHIEACASRDEIVGVIVGKALHDGRIAISDALDAVS